MGELDVIEEAGFDRYTDEGVDLAYLLIQYSATNSFPSGINAIAGTALLGGDMFYIVTGSAATAIREDRTFADYKRDIDANSNGAMVGHVTAIIGWERMRNLLNCPC